MSAASTIVSVDVLGSARIAPAEGSVSSSETVSLDSRVSSALLRIEIVLERSPGEKEIVRETRAKSRPALALPPVVVSLNETRSASVPSRLILIRAIRPSLTSYRDLEKAIFEGKGVKRIARSAFIRP